MDNSIKDNLTNLYNYKFFLSKVDQLYDMNKGYNKPFSMATLSIDGFENIKGKYGDNFAQELIVQVAEVFKTKTRAPEFDNPEQLEKNLKNSLRATDIIAKKGESEYLVLLPDVEYKDCIAFCARMKNMIDQTPFGNDENPINIRMSAGVATHISKEEISNEELIQLMETSLYKAQDNGGDCIIGYKSVVQDMEDSSSFI